MLATSPFHTPTSSPPFAFLPPHPSPLSPRSANIHGPGPRAFMPKSEQSHITASAGQENVKNRVSKESSVPFSKRAVKKAPSPKPDELKERRRNMFLRKVKEGREERRFESRGEDMMRLDFMRCQRQWEAAQARDAPFIPSDPPEHDEDNESEYDLPSSSNAMQLSQPPTQLPVLREEEVDEVAQMEDQELEALLEYMPMDSDEGQQTQSQNLWSDDDDYEGLFSELMEKDEGAGVPQSSPHQDDEAMDMS